MTFRDFIKMLAVPSDFDGDPYGEATNQLSHIALGAVAALAICIAHREVMGEMPTRWMVFFGVALFYVLVIEVAVQRWKPKDSLFDSVFVSLGAAMALWPVREVSVSGDLTAISFDHMKLGWLMLFGVGLLSVTVGSKIYGSKGKQ